MEGNNKVLNVYMWEMIFLPITTIFTIHAIDASLSSQRRIYL